jgi:hypothetical protein
MSTSPLSMLGGPLGVAGLGAGVASRVLAGINDKPSKAQLALNGQVGQFSSFLTSQAQQEGLDASKVFNNLVGPLQRIVNGGPGQAGWTMAETNAYNTQVINRGAAAARNLGSAAAGGIASIGGGNTPGASAAERNVVLEQQAAAENKTSSELAQGVIASDDAGRENFFKAAEGEQKLPNVFATANQAGSVGNEANETALKSQQAVDTAKKASSGLGITSSALGGAAGSLSKLPGQNQNQNPGPVLTEPEAALPKAPSWRPGNTPAVPAPNVPYSSPAFPGGN